MLTSKDLLIETLGVNVLYSYEEGKRFYMRLGHMLPKALLERVGGRVAFHGEGCDGVTHLGKWEFCVQGNTKNSAGDKADRLRCPGRCVQILGSPKKGWMSGGDFLDLHGVIPEELEELARGVADVCGSEARQLRMSF